MTRSRNLWTIILISFTCVLLATILLTACTTKSGTPNATRTVEGPSVTAIFFDDDHTPDIGTDVGNAFAAEPACKGLSLFRWEGHTAAERLGFFKVNENHWSLTYIPSEGHASASVNLGSGRPISMDGKDAADVMRKVCRVVKGSGGTNL
jgi:hypothetical protein